MSKLRKIMFHRVGIAAAGIILQLTLYVLLIWRFSEYAAYLGILFVCISLFATLWIINSRSDPGYKIGWIVIILLAPVVGGGLYLLLGGNRLSRRSQRRLKGMEYKIRRNLGGDCNRAALLGQVAGADAAHMAYYLEHRAVCPVYGNTATKYYPLGDDCFPDMLEAIEHAEKYVFLEYFIIEKGVFWDAVEAALERKAAQGVDVRVIYDDVGSLFTLPSNFNRRLEAKGIKCRVFNRLVPVVSMRQNNRDHRKYLIVDGRTAFTGGLNIADEYINRKERFGHWKDSAIRLAGDAVWSMTVSFLSMWDFTQGESEHFTPFRAPPSPAPEGGGYVQPYSDCPWDEEAVGQTVYLNLINRAKRYLYLTTPYLIPDHAAMTALTAAAKSGVDVRVLTPHIPDKKLVFQLTRAHYEELLEAGVRVFEYTPGFIHAKNFVADDAYATVGTVNFDYRSLFLHFEDGVLLYGTPTVADVREDFLAAQAVSEEITLEACRKVPGLTRLGRSVLKIFAPLL